MRSVFLLMVMLCAYPSYNSRVARPRCDEARPRQYAREANPRLPKQTLAKRPKQSKL